MTVSPKTICTGPGCNRLVEAGEVRCDKCKPKQHEGTSKNRPGDPFYSSAAWIRVRNQKRLDDPLCEECLKDGVCKPMSEVDHVLPRWEHPELALEPSNLQSLCKSHHSRKTLHERREPMEQRTGGGGR
jgi:5-methylcytosine-specific restriction enzyme A